jgi:hypothetical protein
MLSTDGYIPSSNTIDKDETERGQITSDVLDEGGYFVDIAGPSSTSTKSTLDHIPHDDNNGNSSSSMNSLLGSKPVNAPWPLHQVAPDVVQPVSVTAETDKGVQQGLPMPPLHTSTTTPNTTVPPLHSYSKDTFAGIVLNRLSNIFISPNSLRSGSAFAGFLSLLLITMANYMLGPMRDAAALRVGVSYIPMLTLASTTIALASSVPMGWLFEAPNPTRKGKHWRHRVGLTRGETQGTSLALFLRCFAVCLVGYAFTFKLMYLLSWKSEEGEAESSSEESGEDLHLLADLYQSFQLRHDERFLAFISRVASKIMEKFGKFFYVAFFLVVHLMKLHSISLMWGVTSEAMEYEEQAELRQKRRERAQRLHLNGILKVNESIKEDENEDNTKTNGKFKTATRKDGKKSSARLKKLAFVGFGGTLGGILGSVFVSFTAQILHLSGLLMVAAFLLLLSAELSVELGQIMLRHWQEEQMSRCNSSTEDLALLNPEDTMAVGKNLNIVWESQNNNEGGLQQVSSAGSMRRVASGVSVNSLSAMAECDSSIKKVGSIGSMKRVASGQSINNLRSVMSSGSNLAALGECDSSVKKVGSMGSMKRVASGQSISNMRNVMSSGTNLAALGETSNNIPKEVDSSSAQQNTAETSAVSSEIFEDNTFKERLLRGIKTILRSRLLMTIFTYNALYATTTVLLSFQRAELVSNRSGNNSVEKDTAYLANINIASSVAVFALQASGLGALIANSCGQRGTLLLMPMVRLFGIATLAGWHIKAKGEPPNLVLFLVLDEFTKVINFAVAKPVRENLWRGLSNEARYEAKPIVDTLANRWGGGSAAFFMALLNRIMKYTGIGEELEDGTTSLFGFPPLLILCTGSSLWWALVSADLGQIRHRIDAELKKQEEEMELHEMDMEVKKRQ